MQSWPVLRWGSVPNPSWLGKDPSAAGLASVSLCSTPAETQRRSADFTSWKGSAVNSEMLKCDGQSVYEEVDKTLT